MKSPTASRATTALAVFVVLLYSAGRVLLKEIESEPVRIVVALLPIPFFALLILKLIRELRQCDELERRIQLEALAVAFPLAILLTMTIGLLQLAVSLPQGDWFFKTVPPSLFLFYLLGLFIARKHYR
jgi:hypothetical protein